MTALAAVWQALFPARCLGCGLRDTVVCPACRRRVTPAPWPACPRCARPQPAGTLCGGCARRDSPLGQLVAASQYEGLVRTALHRLKFSQGRYVVPFLADLLAETTEHVPAAIDLVAPVPLAAGRERRRGYNQAELLAAALLERRPLGAARLAPRLLARSRETAPQFRLGAAARRENVRGAFTCPDSAALAGRRVVLLDDICTTGATLEACAAALRAAGAAAVVALVVAREA